MLKHFRPKPGRFGVETNCASVSRDTDITASATVSSYLPVPFRKAYIGRLGLTMDVLPIGSSTVTVTFYKYSKSGAADVALSAATNIKSGGAVTVKQQANIALLTTLTDAQLTLLEGDTLRIDIIAAGTVTTQPVNITATAELLIQE